VINPHLFLWSEPNARKLSLWLVQITSRMRYYPIQYLERDVGIPFLLVTLSAGTLIGAVADEKDRARGAVAGGLIGLAIRLIIEALSNPRQ